MCLLFDKQNFSFRFVKTFFSNSKLHFIMKLAYTFCDFLATPFRLTSSLHGRMQTVVPHPGSYSFHFLSATDWPFFLHSSRFKVDTSSLFFLQEIKIVLLKLSKSFFFIHLDVLVTDSSLWGVHRWNQKC